MNQDESPQKIAVSKPGNDDMSVEELIYWAEFSAWTALGLIPFLWWINGPSVSTDQFCVRCGLLILSATTALTLRSAKWWKSRHSSKIDGDHAKHADSAGANPS